MRVGSDLQLFMWEDVSLCFLQTRASFSRIRGSYPFRRRARCTAAGVDDISTPRRSAAARARDTSQHQQNASDIIFDADFTVDHSLAASLIRPRRGRRGRVAAVIRDTSNRPLQEPQLKYQGLAIAQTAEHNLDSLQQRGSRSQPGPDPLPQTQTHQNPITAPGRSPLRARSKGHGNLPSQISVQCSALAIGDKTMEGASHLLECTPWRGEGVSMSGKNSRLSAAPAPSQKAQQQRSGDGLTPPPPPLVPAPMGGGMGPPAGSVMSGWALAGGQPQMNSVYRLIRKKELQHNHHHRHYPDQFVNERGADYSDDDGGGESQQSQGGMSAPLRQRPPVRGSPGARDVSPRLGDVRRHRQMPSTQPKMQPQPQPQPPQHDDAQQRQRQGDGQVSEGHFGSRLDSSLRRPPPALPAPFSSGHAAVDRVVRIRQIEMQRRQRRRNTDGDGGGIAGDGTDSRWDYGSRQASSWDARPPAGFVAGPADAATPTHAAPVARAGVWAIDKVPTALLGGRSGSVWGHGGSEHKPDGGGGTDGAGDRNVIQVMLASPSGVGSGGGGGGRGGDDGEGSSVSSLLRETLMSDLSLLNPVYRMIRKHELLQRHPNPNPAAKASGSGSCSPSAAGTASPFTSSPASSIDPWATDDFADVMLGGLMLTPPPPPPAAPHLNCISKSESGSGSGSIFGSGSVEAVSGTASSSRQAATDTASAVQAPGRLNPVLRLIRKKQLQQRLRLRGRLGPENPTSAATTALFAPVTVGASDNVTATDGGDDAFSHASRSRGTTGVGSGSSGSGDTVAAAWEIGPTDAVGGRAVLNPVYRLIRKKQLQSKRASREAAAAAAAAATADSSGRDGPGVGAAGLLPFRVAKDAGGETTTWQPRRAPFFDLGFGDYYGSFRSPASTLADALDPMAARSGSGFGSGPLPGLESDLVAASRNERDVVIQIDNATAAGSAEPLVLPPASSPSPQLLGSRVTDQLTSSMVGERPHMNHVYRLIRKKELQLRQRGVLARGGPVAAIPVEGSTSAVHGGGRNGSGGADADFDADASISNVRSAPALLPLPLSATAVRPSSRPPAWLHPFDPIDDQDGVAVSGTGAAGTLTSYSSRLLMGGTYDEEQDEVYGDAGDDEGTFWSATSEEDSGDELQDEHDEVLSSSREDGLVLAPLALGPWPQVDAKQHEAVVGQGLRARAVDAIEIHTTSDATETPQGLRVQRRRRQKQDGKKVTVSEEGGEEREREKAVAVQDSSGVQMELAVREEEEPDGKEATAAAAAVEVPSCNEGNGQSQRQQLKRSHAEAPTGSAVAATATMTVTALDGCLESKSTSRQHASGRRGRSRSNQDVLLVAAGKGSTVSTITKSSGDGHGDGLGDGVPCGVALITPRRRRIEELKASLRAKLLRLATTGPGGGGGGGANTNRTPQLLSGPPSGSVSEPSQRDYQSPSLSPPAAPEAAALAATKVRHEGSLPSAETAGACGCAESLGATTSSAAAVAAVATDASRGAAASNTKDLNHSASITAVSRDHESGSVAALTDAGIERESARDSDVAPAVTARPLPWQLTRRGSASTGGSASSFANGRSGIQIRRTGSAHRPPGLLRFLLETSPGPDGVEFAYATQATVQSARGPQPDGRGGGDGVSSTAVRAPRRLFSGIAQLWDAVGIRVGPPPPTLPEVDLDEAAAAASVRDLAQLGKLLVQEGVTEATARRLSGSWLVQSRGWEPKDVLERLRGLQRVLAGPAPSSVPPAHTPVPEAKGAVPPLDAPTPPRPERFHAADEEKSGAGASTDWPRAGAGGGADAVPGITTEPGLAVAAAAAAKQPNLLTRDPAALETNLRALATTLRMDRHGAQKMVRTWPSLLELRPASLAARLITLATGLGHINNFKSSGFQYGGQASLIRAGNVVAAGDGDGDGDGDGSSYEAVPHGETSQTFPEAIPWDAVESAVDFVRRYPPALALTQTAVAARMLALSSAIAATLQQERVQEEQQEQQHGLSAESVALLKPSISTGATAPSSPTEHNTWSRGPSEVPDYDLSCNTAGPSSSGRAEPGTAAAPSVASDLSHAATARALELVSGHPGILGYSPDALAARWKALEAAIMHAEAELLPAASQVECAAVDQMVLQGNGRVAAQGLQASLNQEREPHQDANLYQGLKQGRDVDKNSRETILRPEMDRTGLDRTSPDRAVKRSLKIKGPQSRAGRLPWRRQLLEGPPAAVARCLAASEERLQRLAFLASSAVIGATTETNAAALGGHEAGGSVDGVAAAGSSALIGQMDGPAITTGETAATIALDLNRGRRSRGSQRKERLVAQRHEYATTSADGRVSSRTEETVLGASQRLKSLSLCTILAMSTERFDKRYPSFAVWLRQQQEAGMGTGAGARMKGATEAAATWSSTGPAKTASTEKRQGQRGRR